MPRKSTALMLLPAALTLLAGASAGAQGSSELRGRVLSDSGVPIAGATITLTSIRYSVRTDSVGWFRLAGTPGSTLTLSLGASGFRDDTASVVLGRGKPVIRDFVLVPESAALPDANPSDRVLRGRVLTADAEPVSYANVMVNGGRRFVSDDSGRFTVPITTDGNLTIVVRRIGFEAAEVRLGSMPDTAVRIRLTAVARVLPGTVVTGRAPYAALDLGGFYRRMAETERGARVAYFVTPEDLAMRNPTNVTDAVEQFPNIRTRPIDEGAPGAAGNGLPLARKFRIEDRQGCPLTVYLDRIRIQPISVGSRQKDEQINTLIQPHSVAGIEVYPRSGGTPPEFPAVGSTCGVVLIWSK